MAELLLSLPPITSRSPNQTIFSKWAFLQRIEQGAVGNGDTTIVRRSLDECSAKQTADFDNVDVRRLQMLIEAGGDNFALGLVGELVLSRDLLQSWQRNLAEHFGRLRPLFFSSCPPTCVTRDLRTIIIDSELPQSRRVGSSARRWRDRVAGKARQREAIAFHIDGEMTVMQGFVVGIQRD